MDARGVAAAVKRSGSARLPQNWIPQGSQKVAGGLSLANATGNDHAIDRRPRRGRRTVCNPVGIVRRDRGSRTGGAPLRDDLRLPSCIPSGSVEFPATANRLSACPTGRASNLMDARGVAAAVKRSDSARLPQNRFPKGSQKVAGGRSVANATGNDHAIDRRPRRGRRPVCNPVGIVLRNEAREPEVRRCATTSGYRLASLWDLSNSLQLQIV